jgi:RNA polymerase sigma-70 factor (ECF subfamily)
MDLEEAYDRFGGQLYRHALALTRQTADAEDAVQGVLVKLAGRLAAREEIRDMEAYLHVAVHREAQRLAGGRRPGGPLVDLVAPKNGASPEETVMVNQALGGLPPEQREVVMLHIYGGMTFRRIAEVLGIPPDTAASRYRYAREKLKESLGGD